MSKDLLEKIAEVDMEVADSLKDGGLTSEDVKELCYDSLKEIIPGDGMKGILLRSRIWKVISQENDKAAPTTSPKSTTKTSAGKRKFDIMLDEGNDADLSEDEISITKAVTSTEPAPPTSPSTLQVKSPVYTIYRDRRVDLASQAGNIPEQLLHDIVRGTVSNMISMSLCEPWNRLPTAIELREMAKSLIVTYPLLRDPVNGHERLFNRLKKRMYNKKPVENKRGPNKKKDGGNKMSSYLKSPEEQVVENPKIIDNNSCGKLDTNEVMSQEDNNDPKSSCGRIDQPIMGRLYKSLLKEMQKSKPSPSVINTYLNQQFESRRQHIKDVSADERCSKLFELYPCFKNPVEIIEEVRRITGKAERNDPQSFMNECLERFNDELDVLLYFGSSKQRIEHCNKPGKVAKVIHLMKNLHLLFGNTNVKSTKSSKKVAELIYLIKDHEDPEVVCSSRRQNVKGLPLLCIDKTSAYLMCSGNLVFIVELQKIMEAVLALIGLFYLLDVDYPKSHELGLTMLQNLVFQDLSTPGDLLNTFQSAKEAYLDFQQSSSGF